MLRCVCTCCYVTDGVGLGWGGAITFMLSCVAPVLKRSCDAVYVLAATPCIFVQGCQSHGPTVDVASKCFALLSQRDDDTPCATLEKTARMKGFLQKKEIVYAVRKQWTIAFPNSSRVWSRFIQWQGCLIWQKGQTSYAVELRRKRPQLTPSWSHLVTAGRA